MHFENSADDSEQVFPDIGLSNKSFFIQAKQRGDGNLNVYVFFSNYFDICYDIQLTNIQFFFHFTTPHESIVVIKCLTLSIKAFFVNECTLQRKFPNNKFNVFRILCYYWV